jgi:hypothetical protein
MTMRIGWLKTKGTGEELRALFLYAVHVRQLAGASPVPTCPENFGQTVTFGWRTTL